MNLGNTQPEQRSVNESSELRSQSWDDCPLEVKVERCREVVKDLYRRLEAAEKTIAVLMNHSHGHDGKPVVPADFTRSLGGFYPVERPAEESYF